MPIRLEALPPREAIEFFRQKGYRIGFDWRDVWQQEHQAAFTVAKAMRIDLLEDIRGAVDAALAGGTTFADFRKSLEPTLVQKGWWGKAMMTDPDTGEEKLVQLGSTRRLKTIYDTNLRTAHGEGQWERIQASAEALPYLVYDGKNSREPRPEHAAWDGLVLPAKDPFWRAHMPVKAWGCKCRVRQLSEAMLERRGMKVSEPPQVPTYTYVNKRTGEVQEIPDGVDPAFHYPPGGRRESLARGFGDKVERAAPAIGAAAMQASREQVAAIQRDYGEWFDRVAAGERKGLGGRRVIGALEPDVIEKLSAIGVVPETAGVSIEMRELSHLVAEARKGGKALPLEMARRLPSLIAAPKAQIWDATPGREALLYVFDAPRDKLARVVVRVNFKTGKRRVNAVRSGALVERYNLTEPRMKLLKGEL